MITLYFDGGCQPTPAGFIGGWGFVVSKEGQEVARGSGGFGPVLGHAPYTAELLGLRAGLRWLAEHADKEEAIIYGDHLALIEMCHHRRWPDGVEEDSPLGEVLTLRHQHRRYWRFYWTPRGRNKDADFLAFDAITGRRIQQEAHVNG